MAMFSFSKVETGEPSISCQNGPDCTKFRLRFQNLRFQNFSQGWHPRLGSRGWHHRTPIPGEWDVPVPIPIRPSSARRFAPRLVTFGYSIAPPSLDSFILPSEANAWPVHFICGSWMEIEGVPLPTANHKASMTITTSSFAFNWTLNS